MATTPVEETSHYQKLMDKRIAYSMEHRAIYGFVPYIDDLDSLYPIPTDPDGSVTEYYKGWGAQARIESRDRAYGVCGITRHRNRWLARIDSTGITRSRYFKRAVDAAKWYNKLEVKLRKSNAVLCCVHAAEMLDKNVLAWGHVMSCRNGSAQPKWELIKLLTERRKWDARHTTN